MAGVQLGLSLTLRSHFLLLITLKLNGLFIPASCENPGTRGLTSQAMAHQEWSLPSAITSKSLSETWSFFSGPDRERWFIPAWKGLLSEWPADRKLTSLSLSEQSSSPHAIFCFNALDVSHRGTIGRGGSQVWLPLCLRMPQRRLHWNGGKTLTVIIHPSNSFVCGKVPSRM